MDAGANPNVRTVLTWTPLDLATYQGHTLCVQALVQGGADVNAQSAEGWSPVHAACLQGHADCLQASGQLSFSWRDGSPAA